MNSKIKKSLEKVTECALVGTAFVFIAGAGVANAIVHGYCKLVDATHHHVVGSDERIVFGKSFCGSHYVRYDGTPVYRS